MPVISIADHDVSFTCDADDSVLRAGLRAGLGLTYECNVGLCGSCRFEVVEGALEYAHGDPPALTERDRKRNRVLGCQARPLGDCTIKAALREEYVPRFRPLRTRAVLVSVADITHDIREFRFLLEQPSGFRPGQYALLRLDGLETPRAYSMSNLPGDGSEWHFQVKRVSGGAVTERLFDRMPIGSSVEIDGPYGMAFLREESPRDILCLAGGSGLAPMLSIARAVANDPALATRRLHFVYGGRAARDIAGETHLRELPGFGTRLHYHATLSMPDPEADAAWNGKVGFVHELAQDLCGQALADYEIYFAGPPAMADAILKVTSDARVPAQQVHFDRFY